MSVQSSGTAQRTTKAGDESMQSLESIRRLVTDGVAAWLARLVEDMPDIAPERTDAETKEPAVAGWLHRFVREVVTVNPATRGDLTNIQIFLIESALDCVDWSALARDPRFRQRDWSHARLILPR